MKPAQTCQTIASPASWSELAWGEYYRASIENYLAPWWPKIFGLHLLKLGQLSAEIATDKCSVQNQICLAHQGKAMQVIADIHQLPFANKSIDACLLAQTLNYSADPHRLLREIDRVLVDDGWLIISNFNPLSLIGLGHCLPGFKHRQPYCSRMFSQMRLVDWLHLLNYEVMGLKRLQILPWNHQPQELLSIHLPVFGCINLIVARKRTIPLNLTHVSLKRAKSNLALGSAIS